MINTSEAKSRNKTAKDAEARSKRRAEQAQIVTGLQAALEADEQLLGFTRGIIAGGLRGKLTVGFEALFAPYVNIGLTERRVVLQHVQPESGKPNEILPHSFPLSELQSIAFSDIETFGAEPAGRLNLRMFNDQHFRLRFRGTESVESARILADVFLSLTSTRPKARTTPTQSLCPHCDQVLDRVSKFCPYCGQPLESETPAADPGAAEPTLAIEAALEDSPPPAEEAQNQDMFSAEGSNAAEHEIEAQPQAEEPVSHEEENTGGENHDAQERPAPQWADDAPEIETVIEPPHAEPSTEGHESPAEHGIPPEVENEGDRSI